MLDQEWLLVLIVGVVIFLAIGILYLISLQNALTAISQENRKMSPGNVWLLLIPLFNIVWIFIVIEAIGTSFKNEYAKHGVFSDGKPTYNIGLAMAILQICSFIPLLGTLASLAGLVCWIVYWVKVNENKNEILRLQEISASSTESTIFS
jgi:hypothetical protein